MNSAAEPSVSPCRALRRVIRLIHSPAVALTLPKIHVLCELALKPGAGTTLLGEKCHLSTSGVRRHLDELNIHRLVDIAKTGRPGNDWVSVLTPEGARLIAALNAAAQG
ncbi:MAG: MarR family winged helix-turn-helix transcriptional regulator [Verrucomicrobiota bacterium]